MSSAPAGTDTARAVTVSLLALAAVLLCWQGVSWAFQPGGFLFLDELTNIPWQRHFPYADLVHVLPQQVVHDRPTGFVLEYFLYQRFGFRYSPQLACFLLFHFANCILMYVLFRRLGIGAPLTAGCVGLFGVLCTTAQSVTYLGNSFDVLCIFFLLGSTVAILGKRPWHSWLSALLYLLAVRSKETGIVIPVFLTVLVAWRETGAALEWPTARALFRRLWPHYAILAVLGFCYLSLHREQPIPAGNPYHLDFAPATIVKSLGYYLAMLVQREDRATWAPVAIVAVMAVYSLVRRNAGMVFALSAFFLTILPAAALPLHRSPVYTYCPQIFLLLAVCFLLEDGLKSPRLRDTTRNWASVAVSVLFLCYGLAVRTSPYYRFRIEYERNVRAISARTAADVQLKLGNIGHGARVYVNNGTEPPLLMMAGPCYFLKLMRHDDTVTCEMQEPYERLRAEYDRDRHEKYLVDYFKDGSLEVRMQASGAEP